jgi:transposase
LACKTDKIDARVLAVLSERDLVPQIWLPGPGVRCLREQARFRMHLVNHKSSLKNRIHSTLITFGHPCPVSDLFGVAGRQLLRSSETFHRRPYTQMRVARKPPFGSRKPTQLTTVPTAMAAIPPLTWLASSWWIVSNRG